MENNDLKNENFVVKDSGRREIFESGAQRDVRFGKGRYDLIYFEFLRRLALVCEAGALKYGDDNYLSGMPIRRYIDSACRHINNYRSGMRDEDHIVQAAWNLMAIVATEYLIEKGELSVSLKE